MPRKIHAIDGSGGHSGTAAHRHWHKIIERCEDPKYAGYADYGGRGIKVCERWHCLRNFLADMGQRPKGLWLERIDNNGNYEPGNCKWATPKEQMRNKRNNVRVTLYGVRVVIADACAALGIDKSAIRQFNRRHGGDHQDAIDAYCWAIESRKSLRWVLSQLGLWDWHDRRAA